MFGIGITEILLILGIALIVIGPKNLPELARAVGKGYAEFMKGFREIQKSFEEDNLVIDHIFPFSLGGSNNKVNLMSLCKRCNDDKGKRLDYYKSEEGRLKLKENIQYFVRDLPIIQYFGKWLKSAGNARRNVV